MRFEAAPIGGEWHIIVIATKNIAKGKELLADHGAPSVASPMRDEDLEKVVPPDVPQGSEAAASGAASSEAQPMEDLPMSEISQDPADQGNGLE